MRLELSSIFHVPGGAIPFSYDLDLSDLDFFGERPIRQPVHAEGVVKNRAGALMITAQMETQLFLTCDRCSAPFQENKRVEAESLLADSLANEEEESDVFLLDGTALDLDDYLTTAFVLEMDTKHLCSADCKGLCPICGHNLNEGPCNCTRSEIDPRLAALTQLLNHGESSELPE